MIAAEQDREYFLLRQPLDCHTAFQNVIYNVKETERPQFIEPIRMDVTVNSTVTLTAAAIGSEATPAGPETVIYLFKATIQLICLRLVIL